MNNDAVVRAANNMKKRYRYNYSIFDLAYNFLVPSKIFCRCRNKFNNIHTRYKLFEKGKK